MQTSRSSGTCRGGEGDLSVRYHLGFSLFFVFCFFSPSPQRSMTLCWKLPVAQLCPPSVSQGFSSLEQRQKHTFTPTSAFMPAQQSPLWSQLAEIGPLAVYGSVSIACSPINHNGKSNLVIKTNFFSCSHFPNSATSQVGGTWSKPRADRLYCLGSRAVFLFSFFNSVIWDWTKPPDCVGLCSWGLADLSVRWCLLCRNIFTG